MPRSVRFLHCGGFRFDSPVWDGPEKWTAFRNRDLWQTFQDVLSLCQKEAIEFLFITGNLFEQEYVRKETVERVAADLAKLPETKIFITPGRMDPHIVTSAYRLTVWPGNVHIFSSGISSLTIPSHDLTVSGSGWTAYHQEKSYFDHYQNSNEGKLQVMLLHAALESEKNPKGCIPLREEQIAAGNLHYLALGYNENWSGIQKIGDTTLADCGAAEPRSFASSGPHGVILGELGRDCSQFEFRELAQRTYHTKELIIEDDNSLEKMAEEITAGIDPEARERNLYRIMLKGTAAGLDKVQTLQKLLERTFKFVEVMPLARNQESSLELRWQPVQNSERFSTFAQLFLKKLQKRSIEAEEGQKAEYWGLVEKIGQTALGQGRVFDDH